MENSSVNKAWKFKVLTILAIATTLSLGVFMYQGNEVTILVGDEVISLTSYASTVEDLLAKEDILLEEGSSINTALDAKIKNDMVIIIKNPKPYIVASGDVTEEVMSVYDTVGEVLGSLGIHLEGRDYTEPSFNSEISPGSTIQVFRIKEEIEVVEAKIPFEKQTKKNNKLDKGISNIVQEGVDGLKKTEIKKEYINGELNSTVVINETIAIDPISQITERGTKELVVASRSGSRPNVDESAAIRMSATAYDLSYASTGKKPGDKYYGITASGTRARPGVVAVDPKVIPLGTKLYIESTDGTKDYGYATAEDKGGAIKGNKIDLFFETAQQVKSFGRRNVKVYILK